MSNKPKSKEFNWLLAIGPILAICAINFGLFQQPLNRLYQQEKLRFQKLNATANRKDLNAEQARLAAVTKQVDALERQLESNKAARSMLVSKRTALSKSLRGSTVPAASIAGLLAVLERNGLSIVSCQPNEQANSRLPEPLLPASRVLTPQSTTTIDRRELNVAVQGTFVEMQTALRDLTTEPLGIVLVSLKMEQSEEESQKRAWVLTAAVWEAPR